MKKLLLILFILPLMLCAQTGVYKFFPGEYDGYTVNPLNGQLYSVVHGYVAGAPIGIIDGSASIHHAAFVGPDGAVYVIGDNPSNISATGSKLSTLPFTKTPVTNAKSVVTYDNNGTIGYGELVVTNDGKVILMGSSQSGFRGDGTEGNAAEPAPYTVPIPKPVKKVVAGTYAFALSTDGTVYRWGGTRGNASWAPYSCGSFTSNPDLTRIGIVALPEPIVDIIGGSDWSYAIGKSGHIYGWGYGPLWFGVPSITQNKLGYWDLTSGLNLQGTLSKLSVGPEATYALMTNGDLYAWGNNTQAAIGNGQEAAYVQKTKVADWGYSSQSLMQLTPVKVNPSGVVLVNIFTSIADAFYVYVEDSKGNLWNWGRNKGYVLWNGQGGSSDLQATQPNLWDILSPEKITAFGVVTTTPPPVNKAPIASFAFVDSTMLSANGPDTVTFNGISSLDPDGKVVSYAWSVISGPAGAAIGNGSLSSSYVLFPYSGTYMIQLTVTDNSGATNSIQKVVNVLPRTCPPPVICPVCPPIPAQRTVSSILVTIFTQDITIPASSIKLINFTNGTTQ